VTSEGAELCFQTICAEAARITKSFEHPEITLHEQSFQLIHDAQPDWDNVAAILLRSANVLKTA
jgi:aspartate racemase